jgi:hypothetical protein
MNNLFRSIRAPANQLLRRFASKNANPAAANPSRHMNPADVSSGAHTQRSTSASTPSSQPMSNMASNKPNSTTNHHEAVNRGRTDANKTDKYNPNPNINKTSTDANKSGWNPSKPEHRGQEQKEQTPRMPWEDKTVG